MLFLVFAAFAIVLSVPEDGPPWRRIESVAGTWAVVIGQVVLAAATGLVYARRVCRRLDRHPERLSSAQQSLAQGGTTLGGVLLAGLVAGIYGTDWVRIVRSWEALPRIWALDEVIILLPFLLSILAGWIALYPADRAIRQVALELSLWSLAPARPVWRLGQYLSFNLRQNVLIIYVPMIPVVIANDFATAYSQQIRAITHLAWAEQAVMAVTSGLVFLIAPVMLRYIWHTRVLPPGELRDRLEALCRRIGLTYRRILIWESDGMVVNAAVMGIAAPVRYILLSDGLIETMDDQKIEAVFGHEAGHVKHRHIEFYMLFAICSMFIVGGVFELVAWAARTYPAYFPPMKLLTDYLQMASVALMIVIWGLGFGFVSRRFEWQADLFGARSITPPAHACDRPCHLHGTAAPPDGPTSRALCSTAAHVFADALDRIATLNGIPKEARSWRHSSIANRMRLLEAYARDPANVVRLERAVTAIKIVLIVGTLIGIAVGLWLYWPAEWFESWRAASPTPAA